MARSRRTDPRRIRAARRAKPPRLIERRPRPGFVHPARKADLLAVLGFFGAEVTYGLRSVELVPGSGDGLSLGRLHVPGRVLLFDQRPSPWRLLGRLVEADAVRIVRAGGRVRPRADWTEVLWPGASLRLFMLFEVLMHEVGHHLLQQHTGKRTARVARTREHEAFAERFARRCREAYPA